MHVWTLFGRFGEHAGNMLATQYVRAVQDITEAVNDGRSALEVTIASDSSHAAQDACKYLTDVAAALHSISV